MQQQKITLQKQRDFSEKISATFDFLRQNFKSLFGAIVLIGGPLIIIFSVVSAYLAAGVTGFDPERNDVFDQLRATYSTLAISSAISWLIYNVITIITYTYVKLYGERIGDEPITTDQVWKRCRRYIAPIVISSIVVALLLSLSFLFLIIPGFIMMVYVSMINPIIVLEDAPFGKAFSKSFEMIGGHFWSTFGLIIVISIISYMLSATFSIPNAVLSGIWTFNSLESGNLEKIDTSSTFGIFFLISGVIASLASYLVSVIPNITVALQYFSIKEQKESTGLIDQISQMGSSHQDEDETY